MKRSFVSQPRGFTLLEVLIAITITALLGTGAFWLLTQSLDTRDRVEARADLLQRLQRMDRLLAQDFSQIVDRPIRDGFGDEFPPVYTGESTFLVEFTRTGWRDAAALLQALDTEESLLITRSQLQRVAWRLEEENLHRDYWPVLDRAQDTEARSQKVLEGVEDVALRFLTQSNQWSDTWPATEVSSNPEQTPSRLPKAIEIVIRTVAFGEIRRVFPVAGSFVPPPANAGASGGDSGNPYGGDENEPLEGEGG